MFIENAVNDDCIVIIHLFLEIQPCQSNPCENGGTCSMSGNLYNCACSAGYTGFQCASMKACFILKQLFCLHLTKLTGHCVTCCFFSVCICL